MSCCSNGKLVTLELVNKRLITVDLDCDEDWGDINIYKDSKTNEIKVEVGNEDDGYTEVVRFFEELEKDENDFILYKYQTFAEIDKIDFIEWVLVRMLAFCEGYSLNELKEYLAEYGINFNNIFLPDFLWDFLTDEEKKEINYIK